MEPLDQMGYVVELSRQMSFCKDLVVEPSQLGGLKGLTGQGTRERFILVRPLTVKVKPTSSWVGIAEVLITRERDTLCPALDEMFLALRRQRVALLYTRVDALRP